MGNIRMIKFSDIGQPEYAACHGLNADSVIYNADNSSCNSLYEVLVIVLGTLSGLYTIFFIALLVYWCVKRNSTEGAPTPPTPPDHQNPGFDGEYDDTAVPRRINTRVEVDDRYRDVDQGYRHQYDDQEPYPPYPAPGQQRSYGYRKQSLPPQQSSLIRGDDPRRRADDDEYAYGRGAKGYRSDHQRDAYGGGGSRY